MALLTHGTEDPHTEAAAQTWPACAAPSSVSGGGCTHYSAEMANRPFLTKDTDWSVWVTRVRKFRVNNRAVFLMQRLHFPFSAPVWSNGFKSVTHTST